MLACYDEADIIPALGSGKDWENLIIRRIHYNRDVVFDKTEMKDKVKGYDGESGNWDFNHYVPHSRITYALIDEICNKNMTRRKALVWLRKVTTELNLQPDDFLRRHSQPLASRFDFDAFVEWAFEACADYPENIFYGPHEGDHSGTWLDLPTDPKQLARVQGAAQQLQKAIGKELSLAKIVENERFEKALPGDDRPCIEGDIWFKVLGNDDLSKIDEEDSNYK